MDLMAAGRRRSAAIVFLGMVIGAPAVGHASPSMGSDETWRSYPMAVATGTDGGWYVGGTDIYGGDMYHRARVLAWTRDGSIRWSWVPRRITPEENLDDGVMAIVPVAGNVECIVVGSRMKVQGWDIRRVCGLNSRGREVWTRTLPGTVFAACRCGDGWAAASPWTTYGIDAAGEFIRANSVQGTVVGIAANGKDGLAVLERVSGSGTAYVVSVLDTHGRVNRGPWPVDVQADVPSFLASDHLGRIVLRGRRGIQVVEGATGKTKLFPIPLPGWKHADELVAMTVDALGHAIALLVQYRPTDSYMKYPHLRLELRGEDGALASSRPVEPAEGRLYDTVRGMAGAGSPAVVLTGYVLSGQPTYVRGMSGWLVGSLTDRTQTDWWTPSGGVSPGSRDPNREFIRRRDALAKTVAEGQSREALEALTAIGADPELRAISGDAVVSGLWHASPAVRARAEAIFKEAPAAIAPMLTFQLAGLREPELDPRFALLSKWSPGIAAGVSEDAAKRGRKIGSLIGRLDGPEGDEACHQLLAYGCLAVPDLCAALRRQVASKGIDPEDGLSAANCISSLEECATGETRILKTLVDILADPSLPRRHEWESPNDGLLISLGNGIARGADRTMWYQALKALRDRQLAAEGLCRRFLRTESGSTTWIEPGAILQTGIAAEVLALYRPDNYLDIERMHDEWVRCDFNVVRMTENVYKVWFVASRYPFSRPGAPEERAWYVATLEMNSKTISVLAPGMEPLLLSGAKTTNLGGQHPAAAVPAGRVVP